MFYQLAIQKNSHHLSLHLYLLLTQLYPTSTLSYVLKSRDQSNEYIEAIPEKIVLAAKAYHAVVRWLSSGFGVHLSSYHDVLGGSLFLNALRFSLTISCNVFREWLAKRREEIRPWGTFVKTTNFEAPTNLPKLTKRLYKNVEYFQSNYVRGHPQIT